MAILDNRSHNWRPVKVTALCLSRGNQAFLDQAYASWLGQTVQGCEFLVVHDGAVPLQTPGPSVIVPPGTNLGKRRNAGIRAATGDIIVVWDDDDWSEATRLTVQLPPLTRGHSASFLRDVLIERGDGTDQALATMGVGWPQTMVAFKTAILACGGYAEDQEFDGDTDLMMDLQGLCNGVNLDTEAPLYRYREHASNVTGPGHWRAIRERSRPLKSHECQTTV